VDDLAEADLPTLGWSGTRLHLVSVRRALDRVRSGEVEYLVVRAPNGAPIAKVGIDYAANPDAGTLWQMATIEELRVWASERTSSQPPRAASADEECPLPNWTSNSTTRERGRCTNGSVTGRQVADPPPGTSRKPTEASAATRRGSRCSAKTYEMTGIAIHLAIRGGLAGSS
jgi:hypothetical protein